MTKFIKNSKAGTPEKPCAVRLSADNRAETAKSGVAL